MNSEKLRQLLSQHVPAPALDYCMALREQYPFVFKLRKKRITKVGDFSCRRNQSPTITINQDSHPYLFVMTYVHEVAHLVVHQDHGWKAQAHGTIWKETFRQLMSPLLRNDVFPPDLLDELKRHMARPKASSFSDPRLSAMLRKHDERQQNVVTLDQLPEGSTFGFQGRWFTKGTRRRTRILCSELKTKRKFLVPADAPVEAAQLSLL
jgi:hypothetical protein